MKTLPDWLLHHGGANLIDLRTDEGWTALMYAAADNGNPDVLQTLWTSPDLMDTQLRHFSVL